MICLLVPSPQTAPPVDSIGLLDDGRYGEECETIIFRFGGLLTISISEKDIDYTIANKTARRKITTIVLVAMSTIPIVI